LYAIRVHYTVSWIFDAIREVMVSINQRRYYGSLTGMFLRVLIS
jgi:hypothetical protein